jgi:hypothetical protein
MPRRYWPVGWWVLLVVACASARAPECGSAAQGASCTRVLFIGNSYTAVNDLPSTFKAIAASGRHAVYTEMIAPGGLRLADHAASLPVLENIRSGHWNYVVLQEQSQIPSVEQARQGQMFPAARVLVNEIRHAGARPVLYATWARQGGWPENGMPDYASMQAQITQAYRAIGEELHAPAAPVGDAWAIVAAERPEIPLWQNDGSHPTEQGTFLAANVLVATVFHEVPLGLGTRGRVPEVQVNALQQAAVRATLGATPR